MRVFKNITRKTNTNTNIFRATTSKKNITEEDTES